MLTVEWSLNEFSSAHLIKFNTRCEIKMEEEEPGESLHGSDDEKDEENPEDNEYDVDNDFMVPHG